MDLYQAVLWWHSTPNLTIKQGDHMPTSIHQSTKHHLQISWPRGLCRGGQSPIMLCSAKTLRERQGSVALPQSPGWEQNKTKHCKNVSTAQPLRNEVRQTHGSRIHQWNCTCNTSIHRIYIVLIAAWSVNALKNRLKTIVQLMPKKYILVTWTCPGLSITVKHCIYVIIQHSLLCNCSLRCKLPFGWACSRNLKWLQYIKQIDETKAFIPST